MCHYGLKNFICEKKISQFFWGWCVASTQAGPSDFETRTLIIALCVGWLETTIDRFSNRTISLSHRTQLLLLLLPRQRPRMSHDRITLNYPFQSINRHYSWAHITPPCSGTPYRTIRPCIDMSVCFHLYVVTRTPKAPAQICTTTLRSGTVYINFFLFSWSTVGFCSFILP